MDEVLQLLRNEDRKHVGMARIKITPAGDLSIRMYFEEGFAHMRPHFRQRIEDYLSMEPWYRKRNFGDRNR